MTAICIRCGARKKRPPQECANCHLLPASEEDRAKALILSTAYEIDGEYKGKSQQELDKIAEQIRAGHPYPFDQNEVDAVIAYARSVEAIPASRLVFDLVKWIGPPILILAIVYFLIFRK